MKKPALVAAASDEGPSGHPALHGFFLALDMVPGGSALPTIWKRQLGADFEIFSSLFLRTRPDETAQSVPCPWNCGCSHKVVLQGNGTLHGMCQCESQACGTYTVMPDEMVPLELDWSKLAHVLCQAFGVQEKVVKLGLYNTLQLGAWSADAVPVILTLASSRPEFLNTIAVLVARLGQPFIVFAPTNRHLGLAAKELLANTGAAFFALEDHLLLQSSSSTELELTCTVPPEKLFAQVAPLAPDPSDEDLARRTFLALQNQDDSVRRKSPSLYTVFDLYCIKELTIPQIARKCRCSIGTVANRLKLLRGKTGVAPERLRRVAPHFTKFDDAFREGERNYRRRSNFRHL